MNHVFKSIFVTLMLTITLTSTFGQHRIELKIDPKTGNIEEPIIPDVGLFGGVLWVIADPKIKSFQIVEKPGNPRYIFTKELPTEQGQRLHMKLKLYWKSCIWEYTIKWTGESKQEGFYDPKIAVKPIIHGLIEFLILLVASLTSIIFFRKWRGAVATLKKNSGQNT